MAQEIERKFLVKNQHWKQHATHSKLFVQGYLVGSGKASVRVRIQGQLAYMNIKSATLGIQRAEYEYPIPVADADEILRTLCEQPLIRKTRHIVPFSGNTWEIDVFEDENSGLIVAEIELNDIDQKFVHPEWLGEEVSHDKRYYNVNLARHPFSKW